MFVIRQNNQKMQWKLLAILFVLLLVSFIIVEWIFNALLPYI